MLDPTSILAAAIPDWVYFLLLAAIAFVALIAFAVYKNVMMMSGPLRLLDASEKDFPQDFGVVRQHDPWARQQGFELIGCYYMQLSFTSFIAAWQHASSPTFLCIYGVRTKYAVDFVTTFSEHRGLTTGSTKDAFALPHRPGVHVQAFPDVGIDELWRRHQEGVEFLQRTGGYEFPNVLESFEDVFIRALQRQVAYTRSLPLWPVRAIWWFFVTRNRMSGVSVEQQHRNGKLKFVDKAWVG